VAYRDELSSAHRRIADLEAERAALAAELEAAKRPRLRRKRRAGSPKRSRPALAIALTALATLAFYVIVLVLYDGHPPRSDAEHVAAWVGALLPLLASSRLWWSRKADHPWVTFNGIRVLVVMAIASGAFESFSRFGQRFVFFWWAPLASVALLLGEIVAARAWDSRRVTSEELRIRVDDRAAPEVEEDVAEDLEEDLEESRDQAKQSGART
jgi:hypothetical protein